MPTAIVAFGVLLAGLVIAVYLVVYLIGRLFEEIWYHNDEKRYNRGPLDWVFEVGFGFGAWLFLGPYLLFRPDAPCETTYEKAKARLRCFLFTHKWHDDKVTESCRFQECSRCGIRRMKENG
jgi:hypothetical protein